MRLIIENNYIFKLEDGFLSMLIKDNKLCAHIYQSPIGNFEFRILDVDKYVCIAKFSSLDIKKDDAEELVKFQNAFMEWFRGIPFQDRYREQALEGKIDPFDTWEEIKRDYGLNSSYDIKRDVVMEN